MVSSLFYIFAPLLGKYYCLILICIGNVVKHLFFFIGHFWIFMVWIIFCVSYRLSIIFFANYVSEFKWWVLTLISYIPEISLMLYYHYSKFMTPFIFCNIGLCFSFFSLLFLYCSRISFYIIQHFLMFPHFILLSF